MRRYQPLVLQKLNIQVPGFHVRQLALHRHLPETTGVLPHSHKFSQCLFYLTGKGRQEIGDRSFLVRAGTAVFLPPRVKHAFLRAANCRTICLVVDFQWRGAGRKPSRVLVLPVSLVHQVHQQLAAISHLQRQADLAPPLQMGAALLKLLDLLLDGLGMKPSVRTEPLSPILLKLDKLLSSPESLGLPLGKLARLVGYQHDYLNRLVKQQTGLTLGQVRSRKLVFRAQGMLREPKTVSAVSSALGFGDPNYFSRWFHKQTGLTPSRWRINVGNR